MLLSRRQQQHLTALDAELHADPRLAGLLDTFGRLNAADPMPGHEQLPTRRCSTERLRARSRVIAWLIRAARGWPGSYQSSLTASAALAGGAGLAAWAPLRPRLRQDYGMPGNPGPAAGEAGTRHDSLP